MDAWAVGLIVLGCVFGGAITGTFVRSVLPEHYLSAESKDVVRLCMGLVATMAALVLGLMVSAADASFDEQKDALDKLAANLVVLDVVLIQYGPEAQEGRQILKDVAAGFANLIWPNKEGKESGLGSAVGSGVGLGIKLHSFLLDLVPNNERQRNLRSVALDMSVDSAHMRWLMVAKGEGVTIPFPFIAILVFWLTVLFVSFGLFSPSNPTVALMMLTSALSVSGAVFLTLELAQPFDGLVHIPSTAFSNALGRLAP